MTETPKPPRMPPPFLIPPALRVRGAMAAAHRNMIPPMTRVLETGLAIIETKAAYAAVELGLADALHAQPLSTTDLAVTVAADEDALARLLRFLTALGYFKEGRDGRWSNTPMSEHLRVDHPDTVRDWIRFLGGPWNGEIWNDSLHSFQTGQSATTEALGAPFFDWLQAHPEEHETFDAAMAQTSQLVGPLFVANFDFGAYERVCDVGGGTGAVLATVLDAAPHLAGVLFDLPEVVARAPELLEDRGVAGRVEIVSGSFFETVPEGCDLYVLKSIVHDWDDESCTRILRNIRERMAPGGRVVLLEMLMPTTKVEHPAKYADLLMLVLTGSGRERTEAEFAALARRAGLRLETANNLMVCCVLELVAA